MMFANPVMLALCWAIHIISFATLTFASVDNNLQVRKAAGMSSGESLQILGRALSLAKRDAVYKNSTKLDKSWNGATLLS
jgi:hypothetical protein